MSLCALAALRVCSSAHVFLLRLWHEAVLLLEPGTAPCIAMPRVFGSLTLFSFIGINCGMELTQNDISESLTSL